jgi:hypothetical protein
MYLTLFQQPLFSPQTNLIISSTHFNQPSNKWVCLVISFSILQKTEEIKGGEAGEKKMHKGSFLKKWPKFARFQKKNNLKSPCLT